MFTCNIEVSAGGGVGATVGLGKGVDYFITFTTLSKKRSSRYKKLALFTIPSFKFSLIGYYNNIIVINSRCQYKLRYIYQ